LINGNHITDNRAVYGGGIENYGESANPPPLTNNIIAYNEAEYGAGLYIHNHPATLINNTIAFNSATADGGGMRCTRSSVTIINTVVWGNTADASGPQFELWETELDVSYSCIEGGWPGEGTIATYPRFVNPNTGDLRIYYRSPCMDRGANEGAPQEDIAGIPRPYGGVSDIGAYEWNAPDEDGDGLYDGWEYHFFGDLGEEATGDYDGDGLSNLQEHMDDTNPAQTENIFYVNNLTGDDARTAVEATDKGTPWKSIGRALGDEAVCCGKTVVVAQGTYHEHQLDFNGKNITLRSTDPDDLSTVERTVVDGDGEGTVFIFNHDETASTILTGFTILNGNGGSGGIACYSDPTITNNIIRNNTAQNLGGGILSYTSSPTIINNIIRNNSAGGGGGICCSQNDNAKLQNNIIEYNTAIFGGGIYNDCAVPELIGNIVSHNSASEYGGGVCAEGSFSSFADNTIAHNTAQWGGGITLAGFDAQLTNSIAVNNSATQGGGIHITYGTAAALSNVTVANNTAGGEGGGIYCEYSAVSSIANSIVWGNGAATGESIYCDPSSAADATHSCIEGGWGAPEDHIITVDPLFVPGPSGNYYLSQIAAGQSVDSPCIDACDLSSPLIDGTTRTDGTADGGILDMGYHYAASSTAPPALAVRVELSPVISTGLSPDILTRCIEFKLFDAAAPDDPLVLSQEMNFHIRDGFPAVGSATVSLPAGDYTCITARDPLHTLRQNCETFALDGTRYVADFTGDPATGGNRLTGGNLNGDDYIDILDYSAFVDQFGMDYGTGNTTCETTGPHADITGDGLVDMADFSFIQINFLQSSDPPCR
jgi:predicted outer membrane repeat protein